ncbi:hypothetical protein PsYK624_012500 [Phanerochaete sordida]|uniref:F-box domain-containing protein n=1 Tax=Phanerochaete sordida TaxID=48140 RepID=A0A9P3FZ41_9APHY|nr:hypothetical protein PsYK624_012500 [Phanerochaete sordida]
MHHCLLVLELLEAIVSHLSVCHKEMVDASLVCWSFYEPVMNRIWGYLWDISPLLRCLPRHTWKVEGRRDESTRETPVLTFVSVPLPHEWSRFQHHAARVRVLDMPIVHGIYILHESCFNTLQNCPILHPFPLVTRLNSMSDIPVSFLPAAKIFFPSTLVDITWSCPTAASYLRLLKLLNTLDLPRLHQLTIITRFWDSDEDLGLFLPETKAAFRELHLSGRLHTIKSLCIASLCRDGWRAAATLPLLQCLELFLDTFDIPADSASLTFQCGFPVLSELCLSSLSTKPRLLIRCLQTLRLHLPSLRELNLALHSCPSLAGDPSDETEACTLQELFERVASIPTLESLSLHRSSPQAAQTIAGETLSLDMLIPLFGLPRLRELYLMYMDVALAPADIEQVAKGFPRMERLLLGCSSWYPRRPRLSWPLISTPNLLPFAYALPSPPNNRHSSRQSCPRIAWRTLKSRHIERPSPHTIQVDGEARLAYQ